MQNKAKYVLMNAASQPPVKPGQPDDIGYDLTIVALEKVVGDVYWYRSDVRVSPPAGYYFDVVPRSSLAKTGFMLSNSVGIIDPQYTGNVFVPLRKVDKTAEDLSLPCRVVQLILRKAYYCDWEEVESLDETDRGEGGFGSTGKQ